jgi:peptide/nickel transport system substrate-binding protein
MRKFAFAALLLAALGTATASAGDVVIGFGAAVTSIDPHYQNLTPNIAIGTHVFDRLVHQDENQRLVPGLAVSWRPVDDLTWEVKLRQGVTWHDGSPFTADDVAFTFERVPTVANSPSSYTIYTKHVSALVVVDAHTLLMKTKEPYPLMANQMAGLPIISRKHAAGKSTADFNSGAATIGTGPYKFVEYVSGDRIVLARDDAWWGPKQPWTRVTFRMIPNDSARVAALLAGDVDAIDAVPTIDFGRIAADAKFAVASKPGVRNIYLHLDQARDDAPFIFANDGSRLPKNPLRDLRVRRALSIAVNRDAIVRQLMNGQAAPSGQFLPAGSMGHDPRVKPPPYDPDGARRLLTEAGYADGFRVTIHGPNDRYINDDKIVQAIAQMWSRIGVKAAVEVMPSAVYFSRGARNEFSIGLMGWGTGTGEPDSPMVALIATEDRARGRGATNRSLYSNAAFDALLDMALAAIDPEKREALYREATKLAMDDVAIIPLHHQVNIWATKKGLIYNARNDERTTAMELSPAK